MAQERVYIVAMKIVVCLSCSSHTLLGPISAHANGGSSHDVYHGQSSPHWHERKFPGLVSAISRICTYREFSFFWNPNIFVS